MMVGQLKGEMPSPLSLVQIRAVVQVEARGKIDYLKQLYKVKF